MKTRLIPIMTLLFLVGVRAEVQADDEVQASDAVQPRLFDDLNNNGIPDSQETPVVTEDPNKPSEESVDADQPIEEPIEGAGQGGSGGDGSVSSGGDGSGDSGGDSGQS